MNKENYIEITKNKLNENSSKIMINQIENYYDAKNYVLPNHEYKVGDEVF